MYNFTYIYVIRAILAQAILAQAMAAVCTRCILRRRMHANSLVVAFLRVPGVNRPTAPLYAQPWPPSSNATPPRTPTLQHPLGAPPRRVEFYPHLQELPGLAQTPAATLQSSLCLRTRRSTPTMTRFTTGPRARRRTCMRTKIQSNPSSSNRSTGQGHVSYHVYARRHVVVR